MTPANAPLTPAGRPRLARCVVEDGWPLRRAAERFQVSVGTAKRWADRYRSHGEAGLQGRSSRPRRSPRRTPGRIERRIIKVRVLRRWSPVRIAALLGLAASTALLAQTYLLPGRHMPAGQVRPSRVQAFLPLGQTAAHDLRDLRVVDPQLFGDS